MNFQYLMRLYMYYDEKDEFTFETAFTDLNELEESEYFTIYEKSYNHIKFRDNVRKMTFEVTEQYKGPFNTRGYLFKVVER